MRIVLKKGKQRELIESAKRNRTWKELSDNLGYCLGYVIHELRNEKRFISETTYKKLCHLINKNFDKFIINRLKDNWGQVKGGTTSIGNTKNFNAPSESMELAELFGIILGDGHVEKKITGKKARCYSIVIAGDSRNDRNYLIEYVSHLLKTLFGEKGSINYGKDKHSIYLKIHGKKIVEFVENKGILNGNKKMNSQSIPAWILKDDDYLRVCLRGLVDTDGCVYYISKKNKNLRISFTSYIPKLLNTVRNSFIKLGFHPSKVIVEKNIYLSRKEDINKFMHEIGFSNDKHLKRIQFLTNNAPMV